MSLRAEFRDWSIRMRKAFKTAIVAVVMLLSVSSLAIADTVFAVAPPFFLFRFDTATPSVIEHVVVVKGLQPGERLEARLPSPHGSALRSWCHGRIARHAAPMSSIAIGHRDAGYDRPSLGRAERGSYAFDFNPTVDHPHHQRRRRESAISPNSGARRRVTRTSTPGLSNRWRRHDRSFDNGVTRANATLYAITKAASALVTIGGISQTPNTGSLLNGPPLGIPERAGEVGFDIPRIVVGHQRCAARRRG